MSATSRKRNKLERKLRRQAELAAQGAASAPAQSVPEPAAEPAAPVRKRVQRLLETSARELEQAELEVLDEMFETAREAIALYRSEVRERSEALRNGRPLPKRWQISPGIAEKLMAKVARILEIRVARRIALREMSPRLAG
jgi:hypothetical protein